MSLDNFQSFVTIKFKDTVYWWIGRGTVASTIPRFNQKFLLSISGILYILYFQKVPSFTLLLSLARIKSAQVLFLRNQGNVFMSSINIPYFSRYEPLLVFHLFMIFLVSSSLKLMGLRYFWFLCPEAVKTI